MKIELENKLIKDFPVFFKQTEYTMDKSCMYWGIECEDGWEPLLRKAITKIVKIDPNAEATQIKEKYGSLRLYISTNKDKAFDVAEEAEDKSCEICEICGKPGTINENGWLKSRCKKCEDK
jgi:hypothetical protein